MKKYISTGLSMFAATFIFIQARHELKEAQEQEEPLSIQQPNDGCSLACFRLRELGCDEGRDIAYPDGGAISCDTFCRDTQKLGVKMNVECVAALNDCSKLESECMIGTERRYDPKVKFR